MRARSENRPRESRPRRGAPGGRPDQENIIKKKEARLKPWVRRTLVRAREAIKESARLEAFFKKKGWVTGPLSP